jgi:hypothetical protein
MRSAHSRLDYVPSDLWADFERYGVLYLPGLFNPVLIARIGVAADRIYASRDEKARRLMARKGIQLRDDWRAIGLNRIRLGLRPLTGLLMHTVLVELGWSYLGKKPVAHVDSYVRVQTPTSRRTHLPFHRDQTVIGSRLLNIWIPLVACGRDAPGLEIVAGSDSRPLDPADPLAAGLVERARLDEASVLAAFPAEALWRPVLSPGDALVFSGETIHRTHIAPGMKRPRASIDLRLV